MRDAAAETAPPPPEEALDLPRLALWLRAHLGLTGEISASRFTSGHANLTYLLRVGGQELVLRRPPLGPVAPGAHDMRREHRVLAVLHRAFPLAPRSLALCEDESVIGAVFMLAERRRGAVITTDLPAAYRGRPDLARRIGEMMIDVLAELHAVDAAAIGLDTLGRPEGFVARQLEGWARRWHDALEAPRGETAPLLDWLAARMPASAAPVLLHNDFKLDNLLVDPADPARPVAVLDWDMCTRGDPLLDLGYLLTYWAEPKDDPRWIAAAAMPFWYPGFPSRAEAVARYAARTGRDVGAINWYCAFSTFKLAVIIQQIYIRYRRGQTTDARFAAFGTRVDALLGKAMALAGR
ncbi:MAG: phosphotransferase family protein [Rhodospirillales bacterium]|nr:phosphotransferase family protein [Rhodospirillales bacterium]MDE2198762.1 phosphotransferase family protein [Rhodospirillales bacterium]